MPTRLNNPDFMTFPLKIGGEGAAISSRRTHVREQIEQVLFTVPGERWFRPEFGVGVLALVFEPNNQPLREITKKRLTASLTKALSGDVKPSSLVVEVENDGDKLRLTIGYTLATISHSDKIEFVMGGG